MDYTTLSKEELIAKLQESEQILGEYQESSKELEEALEDELSKLDKQNTAINRELAKYKRDFETATSKIYALTTEKNHLLEAHQSSLRERDDQIHKLKQQLVSVEISNDSFENSDRLLGDKLELANQFNNELLERLALVESDLERDRRKVVEQQLHLSNHRNEARDLREKVRHLEEERKLWVVDGDPDMSVISISRVLDEGPPQMGYNKGMLKQSGSLKMAKSITHDVQAFLNSRDGKPTHLKTSKSSKHLHDLISD